jgi:predicted amidophosphoribosyltransferase
MYCPYCKEELKVINEEFYCKAGNSYFSKHMVNVFNVAIDNSKEVKVRIPKVENSETGRFFCVNCGSKMMKIESMHEVCTCCGFEINKRSFYEIVETNPHCSFM